MTTDGRVDRNIPVEPRVFNTLEAWAKLHGTTYTEVAREAINALYESIVLEDGGKAFAAVARQRAQVKADVDERLAGKLAELRERGEQRGIEHRDVRSIASPAHVEAREDMAVSKFQERVKTFEVRIRAACETGDFAGAAAVIKEMHAADFKHGWYSVRDSLKRDGKAEWVAGIEALIPRRTTLREGGEVR
jgi:pentatricopeptide repeat protein